MKQLLDYNIISNSNVASATQDTDTMSLASTATMLEDSEGDSTTTPQFGGTVDGFKLMNPQLIINS